MTRSLPFSLVFLVGSVSVGCTGLPSRDAGRDIAWSDYNVSLGLPTRDAGFVPLQPGDPLPIRVGFQGFTFARVIFVAQGDVPPVASGRTTLNIDGVDTIRQNLTNIDFAMRADGQYYSSPVMVFANDIVGPAVNGRHYQLDVNFTDGSRRAAGSVAGSVFFDSACIDDGSGGCLAPDGGADASTDAAREVACPDASIDASDGLENGCSR